jgi:hypothetical protein
MYPKRYALPAAGLITGPLFWALSFNANYALVPWQCASKIYTIPWLALACMAGAATGGIISAVNWIAAGRQDSRLRHEAHTDRFLAGLGMMAAALFAAVILLHIFAGIVFDGCER